MKSFFPPPWQIPGLLDGSVSAVSWPMKPQPEESQIYTWKGKVLYEGDSRHLCWNGHVLGDAAWERDEALDKLAMLCSVQPGDVLAGKETFHMVVRYSGRDLSDPFVVFRDGAQKYRSGLYVSPAQHYSPGAFDELTWKSPVTMPLWASRLHLRVLSISAQRCAEATEEDAIAELPRWEGPHQTFDWVTQLKELWQPAYARRGLEWEKSWRWVVRVERVK